MRARSEGRAGKQAGRGVRGGGEVPSDSPAVVRTELTLLSFPLTAASTVRKLNPVAAWCRRRSASALLRAVRAGVRCSEPSAWVIAALSALRLPRLSLPPAHGSRHPLGCFPQYLIFPFPESASVDIVTSVSPLFQFPRLVVLGTAVLSGTCV